MDYVLVMKSVELYRAWRNQHAVVAYAMFCSMVLRLLIVFSASLFAFQQTAVHQPNVGIELSDSFSPNASNFDDIFRMVFFLRPV